MKVRVGVCERCGGETRTRSTRGVVPKLCRPCRQEADREGKRSPAWTVVSVRGVLDTVHVEFALEDGATALVSAPTRSKTGRQLVKLHAKDTLKGKKWKLA